MPVSWGRSGSHRLPSIWCSSSGMATPGATSLHPLNGELNLPVEKYSYEVRCRVALEAAASARAAQRRPYSNSQGRHTAVRWGRRSSSTASPPCTGYCPWPGRTPTLLSELKTSPGRSRSRGRTGSVAVVIPLSPCWSHLEGQERNRRRSPVSIVSLLFSASEPSRGLPSSGRSPLYTSRSDS
jgi:hypothetical protein